MRLTYVIICLVLSLMGYSQSEKSLLWEISGNGLEKSSYLYGTMHVSKKIAFRLDDVFYEALDSSEIVALESDPETWLESEERFGSSSQKEGYGFTTKGFYTHSFALQHPRKKDLASYLAFEERLVNSILYRTNEYSQNFEEDTYLDMFIYQAGSRFNKPILALEKLEESAALVGRASLNSMKMKPDEWLQKRMQQQDLMFLMQDAYRERNLNLLDSIDKAMYTDHYLKNMLYIRNENMARSLDSAMQKAKVFAGIGAAHLPGTHGVIALLQEKGYVVQPLVSEATEKGQKLKDKFVKKIREHSYNTFGPDDNFFTISLPNKLYPISERITTVYVSPDLANGSYLMVNRIPTYASLKAGGDYTIEDIEQLLFENIPGTILSKTPIINKKYKGLDIRNKLKNGNHQRYQIYITPLEILIFKMGGEGDYVINYSDIIFNSLKFKAPNEGSKLISSDYKDFEISMPGLHKFTNASRGGSRNIEGYDPATNSYYFLKKTTLNDLNFIEEDTFELKQIQKRIYQDLKLKPKYNSFENKSLTSKAVWDSVTGQNLHLKTVIKRGDYYLLGVRTTKEINAKNFFNSFKIREVSYPEIFKKVVDTAMHFSTVTSVEPPKFVENSNYKSSNKNKAKAYSPYSKKSIYQNKNNEAIEIEITKSHDYLTFSNIDSIWALRKKQYSDKKFTIQNEKTKTSDDGSHELQFVITDTASTRGILIKNIIRGGLFYQLKSVVDTISEPSPFISAFFDNFKPEGEPIGRDLLEDKTADFFAALRQNDSIVIKGYRYLLFDERHIDSLTYYIAQYSFDEDKKHIQSYLIKKLGELQHHKVIPFMKDLYAKSYNNSSAQIKILQSIARKKTEASASLLLDLMSQDLPLVSNTAEIKNIFKPFEDSLELAKRLYPELLEYSSITEYKAPIFSLLAQLKREDLVKPAYYKKYRGQLLNDAKILLKRHLGEQNSNQLKTRQANYTRLRNNKILEDYVVLLYPFAGEREMGQFFNRLLLVKDPQIRSTYVAQLALDGKSIPAAVINSMAYDINSRLVLYTKLMRQGKSDIFPHQYSSEQSLAEALIYKDRRFDSNKDKVIQLGQRSIIYKNNPYTAYYFKTQNSQDYHKNFKVHIVVFADDTPFNSVPYYINDGLRMADTDTEEEAMNFVTETFILKDRKRAIAYRPNQYRGYGSFGF
ncbi:TraB/GumN family protein [Eudoraea sp.]|uniref:TraB/GumN family protein n=1 Tax=Eudoraea sp. TaxID=1979955 RepID=UPI003C7155BE